MRGPKTAASRSSACVWIEEVTTTSCTTPWAPSAGGPRIDPGTSSPTVELDAATWPEQQYVREISRGRDETRGF
jgi:hypothetical protein